MATATRYTLNDTTPTLIFSGVGNVVLATAWQLAWIGGSGVTASTGFRCVNNEVPPLNVNSPDEIYGIAPAGTSPVVSVLEVR